MPCNNPPPCGENYSYYKLSSGQMCCRRKRRAGTAPVKKTSSKVYKRSGQSSKMDSSNFSLSSAKKKLRATYSIMVNGKAKAPKFISTLEGVNGRGSAEKIANLRRLLSTCKKVGVPLLRSDGKKFKTYKTLVGQCGATFSKTPRGVHLSNLLSKLKKRKSQRYTPLVDVNESVDWGTRMQGSRGGPPPLPPRPVKMPSMDRDDGYIPLASGPSEDLIDLDLISRYVPPPLVMFGRRRYGFGKRRRIRRRRSPMEFGKKKKPSKAGKAGPLGRSFKITFTASGVTFYDSTGKKVTKKLKKMSGKSAYSFTIRRRLGGSVYRVKGPIKKGKTGKATLHHKLR